MRFEIQGIQYELNAPTFGRSLEVLDSGFSFDIGNGGDAKPSVKVNSGKMSATTVLSCLASWTFRGWEDDKVTLKMEGDILPINMASVEALPSSHGDYILKMSKELTTLKDNEIKNLP